MVDINPPQRRAKTRATAAKAIAQASESIEAAIDSPPPKKGGWQVGDRCQLKVEANGVTAGELATVIRVNSIGGVDIECDSGRELHALNPKFYLKRSKQAKALPSQGIGAAELERWQEGDHAYQLDCPQSRLRLLSEIDAAGDRVRVRYGSGLEGYVRLSELKRWEHKYKPGEWVKLVGKPYPLFILEVDHFRTEPDDGLRYYKAAPLPDFDPEPLVESEISHAIEQPDWFDLDTGDRVGANVFTGKAALVGTIAELEIDMLQAIVTCDDGRPAVIDLRDLVPLDISFKIGDWVTEDLNTENAYKEGFADKSAINHGEVIEFRKSSGKFYPWIKWRTGAMAGKEGIANPDVLRLYDGEVELMEPTPVEPPMTAEQVVAEMDAAMQQAHLTEATEPEIEVEQSVEPAHAGFNVGDRVRIIAGEIKGAIAQITAIAPESVRLNLAVQRLAGIYQPEDLERFEAPKVLGESSRDFPNADETPDAVNQSPSDGDLLEIAAQINAAFDQFKQAQGVAIEASKSALEHARTCGEWLLKAKAQVKAEGQKWEEWRTANTQVPSQTASQYQRIAEFWNEVVQPGVAGGLIATLRDAERAIQGHRGRIKPAESEPLPVLEAIEAAPQRAIGTPAEIEARFGAVGDLATPGWDEIKVLYGQIGTVKEWGKGIAVENDQVGPPFPLAFATRKQAWEKWSKYKALVPAAAPIDSLEYTSYSEPVPVRFRLIRLELEGAAIAQRNDKAFIRVNWESDGEPHQSDIPRDKILRWGIEPAAQPEEIKFTSTIAAPAACRICQHRELRSGGSAYGCRAKGVDWQWDANRDWATENDGKCARFQAWQNPQTPNLLPSIAPESAAAVAVEVLPLESAPLESAPIADFQQKQREEMAKAAIAQVGAKTLALFALEQCCESELVEIGKYLTLLASYKSACQETEIVAGAEVK